MFTSVLVANRGEIAVRICRTLRRLGVRSVVATSIPDRHSLAVRTADAAVLLEGSSAGETYLDAAAIIAAARSAGCDAIHPGYGFLSENAAFAEACRSAGIAFIGPAPDVLRALGDKAAARQLAIANDVPVVPGYDGPDDDATLLREASRVGFPLMVKARGGGGGRGMREVHDAGGLPEALAAARREAEAAFGDPGLLLEKLVTRAHHVEVQILGDTHGALVHLGERDCSVQRRRQKLVEESPSPVVDAALRDALTGAALRLARAAGYTNAGTVEFLVAEPGADGQRPFYFLEVNPRLQVEHPVTEIVTGLDLVELQLRVAAGEPLPFAQDDVTFAGHAIEFRINADDPAADFRPSAGRIASVLLPAESGSVRCDTGFGARDMVPAQYDSLLAKLIVQHGRARAAAIRAGVAALGHVAFDPLATNAPLLAAVAGHADFLAGRHDTGWLERTLPALLDNARPPAASIAAVAVAVLCGGESDPFRVPPVALHLAWPGGTAAVAVTALRGSIATVTVDGEAHAVRIIERAPGGLRCAAVDGARLSVVREAGRYVVTREDDVSRPWAFRVAPPPPLPRRAVAAAGGGAAVTAPLAGTVAAIAVGEGATVEPGQLLLTLDAMKMEHRVTAIAAGRVTRVAVQPGDVVGEGDVLVELA